MAGLRERQLPPTLESFSGLWLHSKFKISTFLTQGLRFNPSGVEPNLLSSESSPVTLMHR